MRHFEIFITKMHHVFLDQSKNSVLENLKLVRLLSFDAELKPNCFLWNTVATVLTSRKLQRRKILEKKSVKTFNKLCLPLLYAILIYVHKTFQ